MVIDMLKRLNSSKVIALILVIATVFLLFTPALAAEPKISSPAYGITSGSTYALKNKSSNLYLTIPGYMDTEKNIYQRLSYANDQYSRAVKLNYTAATGKYTIVPLMHSYFTEAYVSYDNTGNVFLSNSITGIEEWTITYNSEKGGYIIQNSSNKALSVTNGYSGSLSGNTVSSYGNVIVSDYTGADSQIWVIESITVNPHMVKNAETIEKKNLSRGAEWLIQLGSSQMNTQSIEGCSVTVGSSLIQTSQNGNYIVVKMSAADSTPLDYRDDYAILEIDVNTGNGTETRLLIIQSSGDAGGSNACRTIPIARWNENHGEIVLDDGQPVKHMVTFKSSVGAVSVTKWELIDNLDSVKFAKYDGKELAGSSYAIIEAKKTGFAVIKAYTDDGRDFSQVIEVNNRRSDGSYENNNYVKELDTENFANNDFELQLFKNYLFKSDTALRQWDIGIDEELGYYAAELISVGQDYAVLSYEYNRPVQITANSMRNGSTLTVNVTPAKGAIILVPGLMASQIFAGEDITIESMGIGDFKNTLKKGTRLWDPSKPEIILANEKVMALAMDQNGNPIYNTYVNAPTVNEYNKTDGGFQYGAIDVYRKLYNQLYNNYRQYGYDIILYEFDWRYDPYVTAQELDDYITENGYEDVIFVGHSAGGNVVAQYIALGERQRERVNRNISIASPYLGSQHIIYVYATGIAVKVLNFDDSPLGLEEAVAEVIYNIPSVYSVLPYEQHFASYLKYKSKNSTVTTTETLYDGTMDALEEYMPNWNTGLAQRAKQNQNRVFDENGKHITEKVDSLYIVGDGLETKKNLIFTLNDDRTKFDIDTSYNHDNTKSVEVEYTNKGDGTVTLQSATVGNTLPENRVFYKLNTGSFSANHVDMAQGKDDVTTINFVCNIIKFGNEQIMYDTYMHDMWYSNYGIYRGEQ